MIVAVIPAKGGSSRLPNKNMQLINGKPMIFYSIKVARDSDLIDKVYVSTDSDEIERYAIKEGVQVIRRGTELGGETPVVEVYKHAVKQLSDPAIQFVIGLQPDHPDRRIDIDDAIKYILQKGYDEVISVDGKGMVNGSFKVMKAEALINGRIGAVATLMDDCTNIHYLDELKLAENYIKDVDKK